MTVTLGMSLLFLGNGFEKLFIALYVVLELQRNKQITV
jgi:hypothetical protein